MPNLGKLRPPLVPFQQDHCLQMKVVPWMIFADGSLFLCAFSWAKEAASHGLLPPPPPSLPSPEGGKRFPPHNKGPRPVPFAQIPPNPPSPGKWPPPLSLLPDRKKRWGPPSALTPSEPCSHEQSLPDHTSCHLGPKPGQFRPGGGRPPSICDRAIAGLRGSWGGVIRVSRISAPGNPRCIQISLNEG